jgi:hypothetical protein
MKKITFRVIVWSAIVASIVFLNLMINLGSPALETLIGIDISLGLLIIGILFELAVGGVRIRE